MEEILEPYELSYSDLITLSSDEISLPSVDEIRRLEIVSGAVMENLGPNGPGLLTITGVPGASALRKTLLPLARKLALLPNDDRKRILKDHGLGSDVPLKNLDRIVSSFAMQLKYGNCRNPSTSIGENRKNVANLDTSEMIESIDDKFKNLGTNFKELGFCMMHLGLRLARICDRAIGGHELENSLLESCTAKGRLIHYHSPLDTQLLKATVTNNGLNKRRTNKITSSRDQDCTDNGQNPSELWQQWHYDYGIFTVLTCPMFISPSNNEGISPSGHSYLQILAPKTNKVYTIKAPPESLIFQVGESADVLSKGKLRSTLHCVRRSMELENFSRATFVVFLQPAWSKVFDLTDYPMETITSGRYCSRTGMEFQDDEKQKRKKNEDIYSVVPQLWSRLKNGMTFAEFSQVTTKQYFGGGGLQSNR
ncbi:hypothetical protein V2J09_015582 [Rumex salicifolius]